MATPTETAFIGGDPGAPPPAATPALNTPIVAPSANPPAATGGIPRSPIVAQAAAGVASERHAGMSFNTTMAKQNTGMRLTESMRALQERMAIAVQVQKELSDVEENILAKIAQLEEERDVQIQKLTEDRERITQMLVKHCESLHAEIERATEEQLLIAQDEIEGVTNNINKLRKGISLGNIANATLISDDVVQASQILDEAMRETPFVKELRPVAPMYKSSGIEDISFARYMSVRTHMRPSSRGASLHRTASGGDMRYGDDDWGAGGYNNNMGSPHGPVRGQRERAVDDQDMPQGFSEEPWKVNQEACGRYISFVDDFAKKTGGAPRTYADSHVVGYPLSITGSCKWDVQLPVSCEGVFVGIARTPVGVASEVLEDAGTYGWLGNRQQVARGRTSTGPFTSLSGYLHLQFEAGPGVLRCKRTTDGGTPSLSGEIFDVSPGDQYAPVVLLYASGTWVRFHEPSQSVANSRAGTPHLNQPSTFTREPPFGGGGTAGGGGGRGLDSFREVGRSNEAFRDSGREGYRDGPGRSFESSLRDYDRPRPTRSGGFGEFDRVGNGRSGDVYDRLTSTRGGGGGEYDRMGSARSREKGGYPSSPIGGTKGLDSFRNDPYR